MKKSKFVLLGLMLIFLLGFSVIFVPVGVKANSQADIWTAPEAAKSFVDIDGRGVRMYVYKVFADDQGNFDYAVMRVVRDYYFEDGTEMPQSIMPSVGSGYFDVGLADLMAYYLTEYGSGRIISAADRPYFYYDPEEQKLMLEYRGSDYIGFWIERSHTLYSDGYSIGYSDGYSIGYSDGITSTEGYETGYEVGYEAGYGEGHNVGYDVGYNEAKSEKVILLITLIMYILSMFLYFKFGIKWILIATLLLWFVPIFLIDNLFIRIFSVIMIIVTIVITFFNEREDDYE